MKIRERGSYATTYIEYSGHREMGHAYKSEGFDRSLGRWSKEIDDFECAVIHGDDTQLRQVLVIDGEVC